MLEAYQGEGAVEAVRDLESKVAKFVRRAKSQFKRWLLFNLFTFPFIAMFYVPYNIFFLQYNSLQLLKWFLTSGALAAFFNLFYRPYVVFVNRIIAKYAPDKKSVSKAMDVALVLPLVNDTSYLPPAPHVNCCGCGTCDPMTCKREGMAHKTSNTTDDVREVEDA